MTRRNILIMISVSLYLLSLALPAIGPGDSLPGYKILLLGWMAITNYQPAWLANIFYFAALIICYINPKKGFATTIIITIALASCSFIGEISKELYIGFYVWLSSMLVLAVANYVERLEKFIADKRRHH